MRLDRLVAKNIRSLAEIDIPLQNGITILSGNVGTGKSNFVFSLLTGLVGADKSQLAGLMRWGSESGSIRLQVTTPLGQETIAREFMRVGDGVRQGTVKHSVAGKAPVLLTATEAHAKLFPRLMGFSAPFATRQIVMRHVFAVPQEQMRRVLDERAADRLDVIRKVFGLDRFALAAENGGVLAARLRSNSQSYALVSDAAQQTEQDLAAVSRALSDNLQKRRSMNETLIQVNRTVRALDKESELYRSLEKKDQSTQARLDVISGVAKSVASLQMLRATREEELARANALLKKAQEQQAVVTILQEEQAKAKAELDHWQEKVAERAARLRSTRKLGPRCNSCLQPVHRNYRTEALAEQVEVLDAAKDREAKAQEAYNHVIARMQKLHHLDLNQLLARAQTAQRAFDVVDTDWKRAVEYSKEVATLTAQQKTTRNQMRKVGFDGAKLRQAQVALTEAESSLRHLRQRAEELKTQRGELEARLEKRKKQAETRRRWEVTERWLSRRFVPGMKELEQDALARTRVTLTKFFGQWLAMLLPSSQYQADVAEDFSPVVVRRGYRITNLQDGLSGGQRTAVGLAYHLAMRSTYQTVYGLKAPSFLILDEPTEGFGSIQLDAIREVVAAVDVKQLLLLTHETEQLSSIADHVWEFRLDAKDRTAITQLA